jgi:hypothetical protein
MLAATTSLRNPWALEGLGRLEEAKQIKEYANLAEIEKNKENENWLSDQRRND